MKFSLSPSPNYSPYTEAQAFKRLNLNILSRADQTKFYFEYLTSIIDLKKRTIMPRVLSINEQDKTITFKRDNQIHTADVSPITDTILLKRGDIIRVVLMLKDELVRSSHFHPNRLDAVNIFYIFHKDTYMIAGNIGDTFREKFESIRL